MATPGRIVLYKLSEDDAAQVNRRRVSTAGHGEGWPAGAQAHVGNPARAGDVYPCVVVRAWSDTNINGQVLLDGNDTFWATSRVEGDDDGQWMWYLEEPAQ